MMTVVQSILHNILTFFHNVGFCFPWCLLICWLISLVLANKIFSFQRCIFAIIFTKKIFMSLWCHLDRFRLCPLLKSLQSEVITQARECFGWLPDNRSWYTLEASIESVLKRHWVMYCKTANLFFNDKLH